MAVHFGAWGGPVVRGPYKNGGFSIWDSYSGPPRIRLESSNSACRLSWAPDSQSIASGVDSTAVLLWNVRGGLRRRFENGAVNIQVISWSSNGKFFACGAEDKLVRIWNVSSGSLERVLHGHVADLVSISYSYDGTFLAPKSSDGGIRIWNSGTRTLEGQIEETAGDSIQGNLAFHSSANLLATIDPRENTLRIWEL